MTRLGLRIAYCQLLIFGVIATAFAKDPVFHQKGVLAEMQSVSCGQIAKSGSTVAGVLLTGAQHTKSQDMLCQEYTLKADRVTYRIRPKEEKHPVLLPVGEQAEFRLKKDEMLLRIPESDNKEREYIVVSMTPTTELAAEIDSTRRPPKPHASRPAASTAASSTGTSTPPVLATTAVQPTVTPITAVETTGSLQVQSSPPGAEVFLDSTRVGQTPFLLNLKPGVHSIQIVMSGYKDWVTTVNVAVGSHQALTATLSQ
jgi:hypothetical protein